jgi:predicted acyltransferase
LEALLPKPLWQIGITIGFFLVWLDYSPAMPKKKRIWLQGSGIVLLVILALLYKGGAPGHSTWMETRWYGILGLIGWCYLLNAALYLFSKDRLAVLVGAFVFFLGFTIAAKADWLDFLDPMREYIWIVSSGALPAITMAGVVTSVLYRRFAEKGKGGQGLVILSLLALVLLACGFALRPYWGISKVRATPSWVMICIGISLGCFLLLIFIADIKKKQDWARIIRPAGTSTLTCYLLPYIHYAFLNLFGPSSRLPLALRTGGIGIVKSLLYSLLIILITGLLEKKRIRLKI